MAQLAIAGIGGSADHATKPSIDSEEGRVPRAARTVHVAPMNLVIAGDGYPEAEDHHQQDYERQYKETPNCFLRN